MAEEGTPRGPTAARPESVAFNEDTPHDILVNVYAKCLRHDQRHARAAESRIAAFELHDDPNELFGWSLWTGPRSSPWGEERTVLPTNQTLAEAQQGRWPDGDRDFVDPTTGEKQRTQAQQKSIKRAEGGRPPSRARDDEQLLLENQVFGEHCLGAARSEEPGDGRE